VRLRLGEARDDIAGQARSVGQSQVTGRARCARDIHMRRLESVTIQALTDYGVLHGHPRRAGDVVTGGAVLDQRAVSGVPRDRSAAVCLVSEPQVAWARPCSRLPRNSRLHHTVVTRCAACRIWPHRLSRLDDTGVARDTERKQAGVFVVWKGFLWRSAHLRRGDQCSRREKAGCQGRTDTREQAHCPVL